MGRQIRVRRRADIAPSTQRRVPSTRLGDISRFSYLSVNSHVGGDERGRERERDIRRWRRFSHAGGIPNTI